MNRGHWIITLLKVVGWTFLSLIILCVIAVGCLNWYFSPSRITELINKEASAQLDAQVKVSGLHYTLFRSWPWLKIEIDSVSVVSHSLRGYEKKLPEDIARNASFLASTEKISAKINVKALLHKKIIVKEVFVDRPDVNIVIVNDSIANFNILPPMKKKLDFDIKEINLGEIKIGSPVNIDFFSLLADADVNVKMDAFNFMPEDKNQWQVDVSMEACGRIGELSLPAPLPLDMKGQIGVDFDPVKVSLSDF